MLKNSLFLVVFCTSTTYNMERAQLFLAENSLSKDISSTRTSSKNFPAVLKAILVEQTQLLFSRNQTVNADPSVGGTHPVLSAHAIQESLRNCACPKRFSFERFRSLIDCCVTLLSMTSPTYHQNLFLQRLSDESNETLFESVGYLFPMALAIKDPNLVQLCFLCARDCNAPDMYQRLYAHDVTSMAELALITALEFIPPAYPFDTLSLKAEMRTFRQMNTDCFDPYHFLRLNERVSYAADFKLLNAGPIPGFDLTRLVDRYMRRIMLLHKNSPADFIKEAILACNCSAQEIDLLLDLSQNKLEKLNSCAHMSHRAFDIALFFALASENDGAYAAVLSKQRVPLATEALFGIILWAIAQQKKSLARQLWSLPEMSVPWRSFFLRKRAKVHDDPSAYEEFFSENS